jgi:transcriptional regulator with XRE-family HTH domain
MPRQSTRKSLNLIKEALKKQGKTQAWLAGELDLDPITINNYCTGFREPSIPRLFKIAVLLKVKPSSLINDNG